MTNRHVRLVDAERDGGGEVRREGNYKYREYLAKEDMFLSPWLLITLTLNNLSD